MENKRIDRITNPRPIADGGRLTDDRRTKCPVDFPGSPLANPTTDQTDLRRRQGLPPGRHPPRAFARADTFEQFTFGDVAGDHRVRSRFEPGEGPFPQIEPETGFGLIGSMAAEAALGQNRLHVTGEINFASRTL